VLFRWLTIFLDIPPAAFERECSFWAALTGWDLRSGSRPAFAYLDRPAEMPVRLLLPAAIRRLRSGPAGCHPF